MEPTRIQHFKAGEAPELMAQAWRLRYRVFCQRLGWEVPAIDLLEIDPLDRLAVHLAAVQGTRLVAYLRMLRTDGPTLLSQHFADLVEGGPPRSPRIWEVSRFASDPDHPDHLRIARRLVHAGMSLGHTLGARQLLAVTEEGFERFLRRCGVPVQRIAGPTTVGRSAQGEFRAVVIATDIAANAFPEPGLAAHAA